MPIDWNAEVVNQLESHWRHQLRPRLDGLTDHEYFWQPVLEVIHHGAEICLLRDLYLRSGHDAPHR